MSLGMSHFVRYDCEVHGIDVAVMHWTISHEYNSKMPDTKPICALCFFEKLSVEMPPITKVERI